ncbi:MAG: DUF1549 domain-containing protein, partial [Verrucomicrobiota bacterium]
MMKRLTLVWTVTFIPAFFEAAPVDFAHEVVPILKQHCGQCHAEEEAKGGFSINTRELFLDGDTAEPGDAEASYFIELILDPDPDYQMPPEDKPRVSSAEVAILKRWVDEGLQWTPGFSFGEPAYEPPFRPRRPDLPPISGAGDHPIDRLIAKYQADREIESLEPIDDATFLRRVSLDLVGLLPTAAQARAFLADDAADKRAKLIDRLLADDLAYTEHWLTFWNDLLRNDYNGTGFITGGREQISTWLYASLLDNKPFDQMVSELIAPPTPASAGFIDGIKWRGTVSAGQTLPIQFSQSISQSFLGINMKCASCHDSFVDRWTLADAYGLAAIYSDEEIAIHRCDKPTGETAEAAWLFPEIGTVNAELPKDQRLTQLAALMVHPENGRVPRTIVNRLWGQLMGRGIVHPLDAMQTEPWDADLLDWLAVDFQDHGYDLRHVLRMITTSSAYQSRAVIEKGRGDAGDYTFAGPRAKRLTAEQFVDTVWHLTGTAPAAYQAPVARGVVEPETVERLSFESQWIWGPSASPGPPSHGEKILLRREFELTGKVRSAGLIAAADNVFTLYLNQQKVLSGTRWTELGAAPIGNRLRKKNTLLIVAENTGPKPNAAGVFCAVRIEYEDGREEIILTDSSWEVSETVPRGSRPQSWDLQSLPWEAALPVSVKVWKEATDKRIGETLAKASVGSGHPVRASLLVADDMMRALGRPNRDQIVTSRPSDLSTLEAVNLSTSETFATNLRAGAEALVGEYSTEVLIEEVYLATLSRFPQEAERSVISEALGAR